MSPGERLQRAADEAAARPRLSLLELVQVLHEDALAEAIRWAQARARYGLLADFAEDALDRALFGAQAKDAEALRDLAVARLHRAANAVHRARCRDARRRGIEVPEGARLVRRVLARERRAHERELRAQRRAWVCRQVQEVARG